MQCRCGIGGVLQGEWVLKTAVILITVVMMMVELNSSIRLLTVLCTALSAFCVLILKILRRKLLNRCHRSNLKAIRLKNRKSQGSSSNLKAIFLRIPSCSVQAIN